MAISMLKSSSLEHRCRTTNYSCPHVLVPCRFVRSFTCDEQLEISMRVVRCRIFKPAITAVRKPINPQTTMQTLMTLYTNIWAKILLRNFVVKSCTTRGSDWRRSRESCISFVGTDLYVETPAALGCSFPMLTNMWFIEKRTIHIVKRTNQ